MDTFWLLLVPLCAHFGSHGPPLEHFGLLWGGFCDSRGFFWGFFDPKGMPEGQIGPQGSFWETLGVIVGDFWVNFGEISGSLF